MIQYACIDSVINITLLIGTGFGNYKIYSLCFSESNLEIELLFSTLLDCQLLTTQCMLTTGHNKLEITSNVEFYSIHKIIRKAENDLLTALAEMSHATKNISA